MGIWMGLDRNLDGNLDKKLVKNLNKNLYENLHLFFFIQGQSLYNPKRSRYIAKPPSEDR